MDLMLYYAELNGDHDRVVTHHVQRRQWDKVCMCMCVCVCVYVCVCVCLCE